MLPTRFVLIGPSHAGNVGAAARAMKVMGFDDLALVAPRWPDVLSRPEALERASGAGDVLARARIAPTLDEALHGITHVCATVMTPRDFGPPTRAPREHFAALLPPPAPAAGNPAAGLPQGVAFLFGCERYGMSNADVYRCHAALSIPANPAYGSLNLAAAVQLIAYDWRQALAARFGGFGQPPQAPPPARQADAPQVAAMLAHWRQALEQIGFLDPAAPKKLMPRLASLFNRAQPTPEEIHILRGIARAMEKAGR
jgi:tRNA/rRNA methyltransferase